MSHSVWQFVKMSPESGSVPPYCLIPSSDEYRVGTFIKVGRLLMPWIFDFEVFLQPK
jgi:hypothetical protein